MFETMANTSKTNDNAFKALGTIFLFVAIKNLVYGFNKSITSLNYFGYEIQMTPGFRAMCILGGLFFSMVVIIMTILLVHEELKKNKAHSVSKHDWDEMHKVSPELQEKINKSNSMSLDELEHLSDKKD
jgi:hypothetical protein